MSNSIGSIWRKWDLHVHTASSYDSDYKGLDADQLLCDALHENNISAVAITDHFQIDHRRILHLRELAPDIIFFPGVELRTDKGGDNLHLILIFSEKSDLEELSNDFNAIMFREKAQARESNATIYWHFEDIVQFSKKRNGIITIHAGRKTNGIDKEITNALGVKQAIKCEIADNIDFFEIGQVRDIEDYKNHVFHTIEEKPLILCSDNHNPKKYSSKENLWIKADLTFEGLKQCKYQPQERVFIGTIPPVLNRVQSDAKSNIQWIKVHQQEKPRNKDTKWFDFDLELNPGLVAVIGNKGSGKSALSDIIGHLCKCKTMSNASFLNDTRFCKLPQNYASDYNGTIEWRDTNQSVRLLSDRNGTSSFEDAQYLPQKYIEDVCNDIGTKFQEEIDRVIFSYVDATERGKATSLSELITNKSDVTRLELQALIKEMKKINENIILLEKKQSAAYKAYVTEGLAKQKSLLERHLSNKPKEVKKPNSKEKDFAYQNRLEEIDYEIKSLSDQIDSMRKEITEINIVIDEDRRLIALLDDLADNAAQANDAVHAFFEKNLPDRIASGTVKLSTPEEDLRQYALQLDARKDIITIQLEGTDGNSGLHQKLIDKKAEKSALIATADKDEREYQNYLQQLEKWEQEKIAIIGSTSDDTSLTFFQYEESYLKETIANEYSIALAQRDEKIHEIFLKKEQIAQIYQDIYRPVEKEIKKLLKDLDESIEFKAEIQLVDLSLHEKLLKLINQRYAGRFMGKAEAHNEMQTIIKSADFSSNDGIIAFTHEVIGSISEDLDGLEKRIANKEVFYESLFDLDYIDISFKLKMGGRSLEQLSPGERGIVLLIFYLALSKNNTPIIIDQPEDNLDNQSVYGKLVPCICAAKKKRQVIIVTHNPNIAVACDAEQIIFCHMDKGTHLITYESGAIEDEYIRKCVIDVLEGTMPAFDLRRKKYITQQFY